MGAPKQLRYYISPAACPNREAVKGNEPFLRPVIGFNPSWFHKHSGLVMTEEWHKSPKMRLESDESMRKAIKKHFPGKNIGNILEDEVPDLLSAAYGIAIPSSALGMETAYYPDKWPAGHGKALSPEGMERLEPLDLTKNPVFLDVLTQIEEIAALTGRVRGFPSLQGPLNIAFKLRGQELFVDMFENPKAVHNLMNVTTRLVIEGTRLIRAEQARFGESMNYASISNCVVNLISPSLYEEFVMPYDERISRSFEVFGIHNCAWDVTPYIESYSTLGDLAYIDFGMDSKLEKIAETFPGTRKNVLYTERELKEKSPQRIEADFNKIADTIGNCDIGIPDIDIDMPHERIQFAMELCEKISEKHY
jgi:hypothetical protein